MQKERGRIEGNRGQVTIFIIVAIIVVAAAVGMYFLYPKLTAKTSSGSPVDFIQSCLQDEIETAVEEISLHGGSLNPELYTTHQDINIGYLCYTPEYYKRCVVQEPLLKNHIEAEIKNAIDEKAKECFDSMTEDFKDRGYTVNLERKGYTVEIATRRINVIFDYPLVLNKDTSRKYDEIKVSVNNNLYNLILIANRIIEWETQYGDANTGNYMSYYSWLRAEKIKKSDGAKIYILTDKETGGKLQFASRSVVFSSEHRG